MRLPHPPGNATRFFARPTAGYLECPKCGYLLFFSSSNRKSGGAGSSGGGRVQNAGWDRRTSMLQCPECGKHYVIGLIAWPVRKGGHARWTRSLPRDQVPGERELSQLRAMGAMGPGGAGWWMPQDMALKFRRPLHSNVTAGCTCKLTRDGSIADVDVNCALHGDYEDPEGVGVILEDPPEGGEGEGGYMTYRMAYTLGVVLNLLTWGRVVYALWWARLL